MALRPRLLATALLLACGGVVLSQNAQLDALLAEAAASWPELQAQAAELTAAGARQREAARAYVPSLELGGSYTLAGGGRAIGIPLGDLLNPAYTALNRLTESEAFSRLDNVSEQFLPNNFYDARLRIVQPIYQPEVPIARAIAAQGVAAAAAGGEVVAADLRLQVRAGYYQLAQARTALRVYDEAERLVDEALRTTKSLVRNGAALPLARERIVAERARVLADRAAAAAQADNALAQLNRLLGRNLTAPMSLPPDSAIALPPPLAPVDTGRPLRPELQQSQSRAQIATLNARREALYRRPRLGAQIDAGSQAFGLEVSPYVLAGVSLAVPLYDGGRHGLRGQRLAAEQAAVDARLVGTRRAIALQQATALNGYRAARTQFEAYRPATAAAERTLHDAAILYRNGTTGYLELLDARTQLTRTRLEESIARANLHLRHAEYLRSLGE